MTPTQVSTSSLPFGSQLDPYLSAKLHQVLSHGL